jgi:hypothetical protein
MQLNGRPPETTCTQPKRVLEKLNRPGCTAGGMRRTKTPAPTNEVIGLTKPPRPSPANRECGLQELRFSITMTAQRSTPAARSQPFLWQESLQCCSCSIFT